MLVLSFSVLLSDHTPGWLHVPVHPLLWRADHGAMEVCFAKETHPHFLSSPCRRGLLSGWDWKSTLHVQACYHVAGHQFFAYLANPVRKISLQYIALLHAFVKKILHYNSLFSVVCILTNCVLYYISVYCCCCLANVSIPGMGVSVPELRPFFYINVADITALETELSYVAC